MKYIATLLFLVLSFSSIAQKIIPSKKLASNLKIIQVTIENKQYDFLFDPGGSETFISSDILNSLNKQAHGQAFGYPMKEESIKYQQCDSIIIGLGNLKILHPSVGIWDVMSLLPKDFPRIDGVISLKTFSNHLITLDLANNSLIVETPTSFKKKAKKAALIQSRFANGICGQELTIFLGTVRNEHTYWLLI